MFCILVLRFRDIEKIIKQIKIWNVYGLPKTEFTITISFKYHKKLNMIISVVYKYNLKLIYSKFSI